MWQYCKIPGSNVNKHNEKTVIFRVGEPAKNQVAAATVTRDGSHRRAKESEAGGHGLAVKDGTQIDVAKKNAVIGRYLRIVFGSGLARIF